jgi:hypothetical protein
MLSNSLRHVSHTRTQHASHVFTVEIIDTKTVSILKKEIWEEKQNAFKGVDADTLILWKVSILDGDNPRQNLDALKLVKGSKKSPAVCS